MIRILALSFFILFPSEFAIASESPKKPNVLVILTDDQGWGDLSRHGNTNLKTPHMDSIAARGAALERFFVQPVCSPTRAEFLTGRCHPRGGVRDVSTGGERLNLDEKTIADSFRAADYATGIFGKWHNGSQYPYHPNGRGFQEFYGFTSGHWGDYFNPPLDHNGQAVKGTGYLADDLTDHAIAFAKAHRDRPFFCYLAFNTPHSPMQVPTEYWDRFKNAPLKLGPTGPQKEDVPFTRAALAMCENLDANIGRVLKSLDDLQLSDNTIVVYFSDNGPNGWRYNGGMKGRKGSTDDGGVRSPCFIRWPGHIPPGTQLREVAGAVDLMPTLTELTGVKHVGTKPIDGISHAKALLGEREVASDRFIVQHWAGKVSARTRQHRLDADGKLYDLDADVGQKSDITAAQPELSAKLKSAVADWRRNVLSDIDQKDDRPFTVGYREFPIASLPARDGIAHGTIQRSARAPNCSYFTHWTKTDDCITWNVEVATAGNYRVEVLYTCAKENIGSTVQFQLGTAKLGRKVDEAHDPQEKGAENDRVPRVGESFVKDFKPWSIGEVHLASGHGIIELKCPEIPGKQSLEVRSLIMTRIGD